MVESARHGEDASKAAAIVADAETLDFIAFALHRDVHAFGEHGVQMGAEHDQRLGGFRAGPAADDVAFAVGPYVLQAVGRKAARELFATFRLFEWRGGDLADTNLLFERPGLIGLDGFENGVEVLGLCGQGGESEYPA